MLAEFLRILRTYPVVAGQTTSKNDNRSNSCLTAVGTPTWSLLTAFGVRFIDIGCGVLVKVRDVRVNEFGDVSGQ